ncbi:TPA: hypothetical protein ACPZLF_004529, partial [Yersinia enterocolitica]
MLAIIHSSQLKKSKQSAKWGYENANNPSYLHATPFSNDKSVGNHFVDICYVSTHRQKHQRIESKNQLIHHSF